MTTFVETLRSDKEWDEKVNQVNETLEFMKDYVVTHFRDEEAYQKEIGYPESESHKKVHSDMVAYVAMVSDQYEKNGYEETLIQQFAGKLLTWLINHVAADDQKIARLCSEEGGVITMSKDYLAPFADAAQQTLKLLLDVDALVAAQAENDTVEGTSEEDGQVGVVIGITGDLNGEVRYSFPPDTSLEIVKMMSGMEFTEIDEFVTSALGEIANIISGNAVTGLSVDHIICDILPPKINEENRSV